MFKYSRYRTEPELWQSYAPEINSKMRRPHTAAEQNYLTRKLIRKRYRIYYISSILYINILSIIYYQYYNIINFISYSGKFQLGPRRKSHFDKIKIVSMGLFWTNYKILFFSYKVYFEIKSKQMERRDYFRVHLNIYYQLVYFVIMRYLTFLYQSKILFLYTLVSHKLFAVSLAAALKWYK